MRRTIQLTGVDGATGVGTFSCNLPMNLDYFAFYAIDLAAAVVLADIPNINLYAQSQTLRQYNGIQQGIMNVFDKLPAYSADSCLSIHLDQLGMKTVQATYGPTLNTLSPDPITGKSITTARLEVITNNVAHVPNWQLFADVDDSGNGGPGNLERIKVFGSLNVGTAEKSFATVFPFGTPDVRFWRRLLVTNISAGSITLGRLLRGSAGAEVFKRTGAIDLHVINDYGVRNPTFSAGVAGLVFALDGTETGIPEMWDTMVPNGAFIQPQPKATPPVVGTPDLQPFLTVGTMDLRLTASAPATCDIIHSTMGPL